MGTRFFLNQPLNNLKNNHKSEEQTSKQFDIITGFHLISGNSHLFVLEGLIDSGIKTIFDGIQRNKNDSDTEVIFNSKMTFRNRMYANLEVELFTIKLFEPLEEIVKKPLLYIRDMTPKASFDALIKINQVIWSIHLKHFYLKLNDFEWMNSYWWNFDWEALCDVTCFRLRKWFCQWARSLACHSTTWMSCFRKKTRSIKQISIIWTASTPTTSLSRTIYRTRVEYGRPSTTTTTNTLRKKLKSEIT